MQQTSSKSMMEMLDSGGCYCMHRLVQRNLPEGNVQYFIDSIKKLLATGCKINSQDKQGKTALHIAVNEQNHEAVEALLTCGADINVEDKRGKTAMREAFDQSQILLMKHFEKMVLARCPIATPNVSIGLKNLYRVNLFLSRDEDERQRLFDLEFYRQEVAKMAEVEVPIRPRNLQDLLKVDSDSITRREFRALEETVKSDDLEVKFPRMSCLLKMQYWKAMTIMNLRETAQDSLVSLTKKRWPHPCLEVLMSYLSEKDLKNLIAATVDDDRIKPKKQKKGNKRSLEIRREGYSESPTGQNRSCAKRFIRACDCSLVPQ